MKKELIKKIINIIFRIIALPIMFLLLCISYFKSVFTLSVWWVLYGGEMVIYERDTQKGVKDLINKFIDNNK